MKKRLPFILIISIGAMALIIAGIITYSLINKANQELHEKILDAIMPDIYEYCQNYSTTGFNRIGCPTCYGVIYNYKNEAYDELYSRINPYYIKKEGDVYKVTLTLHLFYGRTDYTGTQLLYFDVDKNFNIINENLTKQECH